MMGIYSTVPATCRRTAREAQRPASERYNHGTSPGGLRWGAARRMIECSNESTFDLWCCPSGRPDSSCYLENWKFAKTSITPDAAESYHAPTTSYDYIKRAVMIPMRDGVKLFTVIVIPRSAKNAPLILTRTPYDAATRTTRNESPSMLATLPQGDEVFVAVSGSVSFRTYMASSGYGGRLCDDPSVERTAQPDDGGSL